MPELLEPLPRLVDPDDPPPLLVPAEPPLDCVGGGVLGALVTGVLGALVAPLPDPDPTVPADPDPPEELTDEAPVVEGALDDWVGAVPGATAGVAAWAAV